MVKAKMLKLALLVVGLLVGFLGGSSAFSESGQQLATKLSELQVQNLTLTRENQHLKYINGLAMEFSMDPMIVTLVDHYSREYLKAGGSEWRLLRTPEFMTYIMLSVIYAESKGDPKAIGDGGEARGLTQIWTSTARDYGEVTAEDLLDAETNISYSFKHFHYLLKKYEGNLALALYSWNRGHGTVDRLLLYGASPQNGYAKKVYEATLIHNRETMIGQ
ncbi:MAG: lytic transglycosylase domain-containing protein [Acidobacteriota bacterium]